MNYMKKLCLIYNTVPIYREAVSRAINAEYNYEWYLGENKSAIKEMDISLQRNVKYYKSLETPNKLY